MLSVLQRLRDIDSFHEDITDGDLESVKSFIERYPTEKQVLNSRGQSAITIALMSKQLIIYDELIKNGFKLGADENFQDIIKRVYEHDRRSKRQLRKIHKKYVKNSTLTHLLVLFAVSKLIHTTNDENRRACSERVMKAFEEINEVKWVEETLKIASKFKTLMIVFDFHRDSVDYMDPTANEGTRGSVYPGRGDICKHTYIYTYIHFVRFGCISLY